MLFLTSQASLSFLHASVHAPAYLENPSVQTQPAASYSLAPSPSPPEQILHLSSSSCVLGVMTPDGLILKSAIL